jgi:hypothetical protein
MFQRLSRSLVTFMGESDKPSVVRLVIRLRKLRDANRQFYDLIEAFRVGGSAPATNYLFLGKSV